MMISALVTSAAFLACYLTYHAYRVRHGIGITPFPHSGWKPLYQAILVSHTILAVVILPLIYVTVSRGKAPLAAASADQRDHIAALVLCIGDRRGRLLDALSPGANTSVNSEIRIPEIRVNSDVNRRNAHLRISLPMPLRAMIPFAAAILNAADLNALDRANDVSGDGCPIDRRRTMRGWPSPATKSTRPSVIDFSSTP